MKVWLPAALRGFLTDRLLLFEIDRVCRRYPGAGTPTQYLGLTSMFSDAVCVEIDKGIAQFGTWVDARMEARTYNKKGGSKPMYPTLGDVLGITDVERRGGMDGQTLQTRAEAYKRAVAQAVRTGQPVPDISLFMEAAGQGVAVSPPGDETE